jgi:hypothetical protein
MFSRLRPPSGRQWVKTQRQVSGSILAEPDADYDCVALVSLHSLDFSQRIVRACWDQNQGQGHQSQAERAEDPYRKRNPVADFLALEPYHTMVVTAVSTGLRCSELFAWSEG